MDIKIGFTDNAREVTVSSHETQEEVIKRVTQAMETPEATLTLKDDKGRVVVVKNSRIAWVEIGTTNAPRVGFAPGA